MSVPPAGAAEGAALKIEESLRLAMENADVGIFDIDPELGIGFTYSRDNAVFTLPQDYRTPFADFLTALHPEDVERVRLSYEAAIDPVRRGVLDVEYRVLAMGDRSERCIKSKGRGVFDEDGRCLRVSGASIDITKEYNTREALRHSEEQLRLATEQAEIGMWDMDPVNNRNYANSRVKEMFGIPPGEDPPPEDYFALVHPDDIVPVEAAYAAASDPAKRSAYDVEYRVIGRDGVTRWIHAKGRGVFDDRDRCLHIAGTAMNVTAKREIEEALRRNEEQLRLATEHAEIGMWDVDNVNRMLHWSREVRGAFGIFHDRPVTLEQDFLLGLHPEDRETVARAYEAANDPEKRSLYDVEYRTIGQEDGVVRWVHAKGRGLFDAWGRCVRVIGTTVDISRRKEIERQLQELNETLEHRVVERTAALERSQAALQQAQKMEAIGNLTGGIAHDFNNLLQGLTGSLDLIRRRPEDAERVRRWADAGLQAADRGAKLTAQLLTFSRSQRLETKPLDIWALLNGMRDLLGRTLGPSIEVTMEPPAEPRTVLGGETQLELAVLNLAINARDAMPEGGRLRISTNDVHVDELGELAPGGYVELSVSDSGTGMPEDVAARAFEPFFTTKEVGKGTGLGLSQVYGMTRQAGGAARIRSAPGEGAVVSLLLPAIDGEVAREKCSFTQETQQQAPRGMILVIDDDPVVRKLLAESLDALGYGVWTAENGRSGLEVLAQGRPDLMIIDYAMPGMTGVEVAKVARARHPELPILFASGYAVTAALENALDGNASILRKPFRLEELRAAVANALR